MRERDEKECGIVKALLLSATRFDGLAKAYESRRYRAPIQRMADKVSGWFVPVVIIVALLAFAR